MKSGMFCESGGTTRCGEISSRVCPGRFWCGVMRCERDERCNAPRAYGAIGLISGWGMRGSPRASIPGVGGEDCVDEAAGPGGCNRRVLSAVTSLRVYQGDRSSVATVVYRRSYAEAHSGRLAPMMTTAAAIGVDRGARRRNRMCLNAFGYTRRHS